MSISGNHDNAGSRLSNPASFWGTGYHDVHLTLMLSEVDRVPHPLGRLKICALYQDCLPDRHLNCGFESSNESLDSKSLLLLLLLLLLLDDPTAEFKFVCNLCFRKDGSGAFQEREDVVISASILFLESHNCAGILFDVLKGRRGYFLLLARGRAQVASSFDYLFLIEIRSAGTLAFSW
jgi:hypothetical protein